MYPNDPWMTLSLAKESATVPSRTTNIMTQALVFISYSHKDEKEKKALLSHLGMLKSAGLFEVWFDDQIGAGDNWVHEIQQVIKRANLAILLISANYLNTDFILTQQVPTLIKRYEQDGLMIMPIIAKACAWQKIKWLANMEIRPKDGQPIWRAGGLYVDEGLAAIAAEIADIIKKEIKGSNDDNANSIPAPFQIKQTALYHPCFISYSQQDETFAQRLYTDLQQQGVDCWMASEDMKIGAKLRPTIDRSIRRQDKLLLILSKQAIESDWVEHEVETVFEEERRDKIAKLFPIRLDDTVWETEQAWAAAIRRTRHIGNFTHWQKPTTYQKAFKRLLRDLKQFAISD